MYAFSFVLPNLGMAIAASRPMITTTISSSMSVKPVRFMRCLQLNDLLTATTMLGVAQRAQLAMLHRPIIVTQETGHMSMARVVRSPTRCAVSRASVVQASISLRLLSGCDHDKEYNTRRQ